MVAVVLMAGAGRDYEVTTVRRQLCRNRWLVAYTLLRNPDLQKFTASNMARQSAGEAASLTSDQEVHFAVPLDQTSTLANKNIV